MFKKTLITVMVCVFGAGVLFAQPDNKMEERKKDFQEMNTLVENYKKEKNKKKKAAIEDQIKQKVAANYDRHLEFMEKRVADSEERLTEAKTKLAAAKDPANKEKHILEITVKIISGEKPTLFAPPDKDCPFAKKHKDMGNCGCKKDNACGCNKGGEDKACGCKKDNEKPCGCKHHFKGHHHGMAPMGFEGADGMMPPPPPAGQPENVQL